MGEIAYLITKKHFEVEEVNFEQLKSYTNNIILKYDTDFLSFRRALFELDRLGFNIGIYASSTVDLVYQLKGFKIKLGVWVNEEWLDEGNFFWFVGKPHFITGCISENNSSIFKAPRWGTMGDIENSEIIKLDFIREPIQQLIINTDLKKIYDENHLIPIPSTFK